MTRNATLPLSPAQAARAAHWHTILAPMVGDGTMVTLPYGDGEREGVVLAIVGTPGTSTWSVTLMTDRGPRSLTLHKIGA